MWIDKDAPISLEAAKLLGLPFSTKEGTKMAFKYKRTDGGLQLWIRLREMPDRWEHFTDVVEPIDDDLFNGAPLYRVRPGHKPAGGKRGKR